MSKDTVPTQRTICNEEFKVERNIPVPDKVEQTRYRWSDMQPGDSVFISKNRYSALSSLGRFTISDKGKDMKFKTRSVGDGVRIWRVS